MALIISLRCRLVARFANIETTGCSRSRSIAVASAYPGDKGPLYVLLRAHFFSKGERERAVAEKKKDASFSRCVVSSFFLPYFSTIAACPSTKQYREVRFVSEKYLVSSLRFGHDRECDGESRGYRDARGRALDISSPAINQSHPRSQNPSQNSNPRWTLMAARCGLLATFSSTCASRSASARLDGEKIRQSVWRASWFWARACRAVGDT